MLDDWDTCSIYIMSPSYEDNDLCVLCGNLLSFTFSMFEAVSGSFNNSSVLLLFDALFGIYNCHNAYFLRLLGVLLHSV